MIEHFMLMGCGCLERDLVVGKECLVSCVSCLMLRLKCGKVRRRTRCQEPGFIAARSSLPRSATASREVRLLFEQV